MSKTAFVTGGMGFIGSSLTKKLINEFDNVVLYDNLHPQIHGKQPLIPSLPENVKFIHGDVCDKEFLLNSLSAESPDIIFHFAAETGTGQSYDEITRYCNVNIIGTSTLLECIGTLEKKPNRVLLASSRAIYGEGPYISTEGEIAIGLTRDPAQMKLGNFGIYNDKGNELEAKASTIETTPSPCSIYATSKLTQEYLFEQYLGPKNIPYSILRLQNVYGPGQSLKNPYTGVLSIMSSQIINGHKINLYEDGNMLRDFVFVDDVAEAFIAACKDTQKKVHKLNIGNGSPNSILQIAQMLLVLLGQNKDNFEISGFFRPGDIRHAFTDITEANSILNWQPKIDIESGLSLLTEWALKELK